MKMKITFPGGKKVNAEFNGFTVKTDQSVKAGGEASAPEPFQYFLSSLGTCAGIYIVGFCESRKIPVEKIELEQSLVYDPVKKKIGKIRLNIIVPDDFPEKYRGALEKAASLCAVKKVIENPPEFDIYTSVK